MNGWRRCGALWDTAMGYYSATKKNKIMSFAGTWMQLKIIILDEVIKRETQTIWYHLYVESNILIAQMNLSTKQKQTQRHKEQIVVPRGRREGGKAWEFGICRCKLFYTGWINNKVLPYSMGNYLISCVNHNGKGCLKKNVYMYITELLFCIAKMGATL